MKVMEAPWICPGARQNRSSSASPGVPRAGPPSPWLGRRPELPQRSAPLALLPQRSTPEDRGQGPPPKPRSRHAKPRSRRVVRTSSTGGSLRRPRPHLGGRGGRPQRRTSAPGHRPPGDRHQQEQRHGPGEERSKADLTEPPPPRSRRTTPPACGRAAALQQNGDILLRGLLGGEDDQTWAALQAIPVQAADTRVGSRRSRPAERASSAWRRATRLVNPNMRVVSAANRPSGSAADASS
jgi:hypothetical protein